jgi:hypothetical protein
MLLPSLYPPRYLNKEARACYWYRLLTEISKLLQYKPGELEGLEGPFAPVDEFIRKEARRHDEGKTWERYLKRFSP